MRISLNGPSGNAFHIMNVVNQYLKETDSSKIQEYMNKAMAGDYDNLLKVSKVYCPVIEFVNIR